MLNWSDLLQSIISGVVVGLVVFGLDMLRAKRERRLADFRIAANWEVTEPKPSLRNFDLKGANLSGYDLSKANLENSNLENTALWGTNLNDANLRKTNFRNAKLVGVTCWNAVAFYSDFSKTLVRQRSEGGEVWIPDFTSVNFRGTLFKNATLKDALFLGVNFIGADFSGAIIQKCDFTGSDLTDSKWRKVKKVENCIWKNVTIGNTKNFPKWLLEEINNQNEKSAPKGKHAHK